MPKTRTTTNLRQELFAKEYSCDLNATRAAIAAGYSESTAAEIGSKLLRNSKVKRLIDRILSKRATKLEISGEKILERFESLAEGNVADFISIGEEGAPRIDVANKSRAELFCVQKISTDTYVIGAGNNKRVVTTIRLDLADRLKANESLAKYKKLFADQVEVTINPIKGMSDAQLAERALELLSKLGGRTALKERAQRTLDQLKERG
jgi:phage terminase small subunit